MLKNFTNMPLQPGEMFFQTILLNSQFKNKIVNDNKRYVEFIGSHPRVLTIKDFDTLKHGSYFFARKFDPKVDSQIIDAIDKEPRRVNWIYYEEENRFQYEQNQTFYDVWRRIQTQLGTQ